MLSAVPHARDRAERVRARPQVRHFAQVLERGLLRLNRIGVRVVDPADDLDRLGLQLDRLPLALARRQRTGRDDRAARRQLLDLALVVGQRGRRDDLDRVEAGAVVDVDERQPGLRVAPRANPAADGDPAPDRHLPAAKSTDRRRGVSLMDMIR